MLSKTENKIISYCIYRERCIREVRDKMRELGVNEANTEKFLSELISSGYIDEKRYANSYVNGKLRVNKWGKYKIRISLVNKGITEENINSALSLITEEEYYNTIESLIIKKYKEIKETDPYKKKQKVLSYIYRKGFESQLCIEIIENIKI